jgi:hypothetical protein
MSLSGIAAAGASTKHRERRLGNQPLHMTVGLGQVKGTCEQRGIREFVQLAGQLSH